MTENRCKESEANPEFASEEARLAALAARYGLELRARASGSYAIEGDVAGWLLGVADLDQVQVALDTFFLAVVRAPPAHGLVYQAACEAGSQKALAERIGVSESYVSDVIRGRRAASESLMRKLGLKAVTVYVKENCDEA